VGKKGGCSGPGYNIEGQQTLEISRGGYNVLDGGGKKEFKKKETSGVKRL